MPEAVTRTEFTQWGVRYSDGEHDFDTEESARSELAFAQKPESQMHECFRGAALVKRHLVVEVGDWEVVA